MKKFLTLIFFACTITLVSAPISAYAVAATDWRPGRIIDDPVFTDNGSMSPDQIQTFLNSKVPTCDTDGTMSTTRYNDAQKRYYTRAEWGALQGHPAPFTCLKDYRENMDTKANNYGGKAISGGNKTAAELIWGASQQYRISPKVLLTTIQKESSGPLIVDDWPYESQYTYALGARCPDGPNGADCDPAYAGFGAQIYESARLFRYYLDNIDQPWWPYKKPGTNDVLYNVKSSGCGSATISIDGYATAALYTYTPYQPNQAALTNLYNTGDQCSAYGNRNFWRIYNDWFGKSILDCNPSEQPYAEVMRAYNPVTYKHFYTVYPCEIAVLQSKLGYKFEGTSFYQAPASSPYAVVVHRLYNPRTFQHLWVTTQDEITSATQQSGYRYEGVAFYGVKPEVPNLVAVHRLYNPQTFQHLWVTTQDEINVATQQAGFRYEGVAFYSAPPPAH